MTDPHLARIQAAARMQLPRLAADALQTALQLLEAYRQEVSRLRAAATPAPLPPAPAPTADLVKLRVAVERANKAAAASKATAAEALADLERAKAELSVWRSLPQPDAETLCALRHDLECERGATRAVQADLDKALAELSIWRGAPVAAAVRRCKCGAAVLAGRRCKDCLDRRLRPLTCGCGTPMRKGASRCRDCFLEGRHPPIVVQRPTPKPVPGACACGAVLAPGRSVCVACSRERHLALHAAACLDCGKRLRDAASVRCRSCYLRHRHAQKGDGDAPLA